MQSVLNAKKPPGAMLRYDGRLSTPSACLRIVQVLTVFRALVAGGSIGVGNIVSLQHEIEGFTQCSDPNFLIPPFLVLVSSTGRAWQWQTSSPL